MCPRSRRSRSLEIKYSVQRGCVEQHNQTMPHSAFNRLTPDDVYFERTEGIVESLARRKVTARPERITTNRCLGRPMTDTAIHLAEEVFPSQMVRQCVCALPWKLRSLLGYDKALCAQVLSAFTHSTSLPGSAR